MHTINGVIYRVVWQNGPDGTKRLLLYHGIVDGVNKNHGGCNVKVVSVSLASQDNLALGVVHHGLNAIKVLVVDNSGKVGAGLGTVGEGLVVNGGQDPDEVVQDLAVNVDIVGRHADLSGILHLAPEQAAGGKSEVGIFGDESWVLATELESHRSQGLGRLFGDDLGYVNTASIEDLAPFLIKKSGGLGNTAVDDLVSSGVQIVLNELLQDNGRGRGTLGRLDDGRTAGGDGANERADGQVDRKVVGANDQDSAQRFLVNSRLDDLHVERNIDARVVLCPCFEVLNGI